MNEQGVMVGGCRNMVVLDATRSRMQIKMWILFVKNMFVGSALAERFCCRTTNAFAFQSPLCSTSLYFRPPLAMIYVLDLVWRFSQKTWSTGISAGKHETLLISHGCEWREHQIGWLALEPKLKTATELQVNHCWAAKKELHPDPVLWMWNLLYTLFTRCSRRHCYHKWALTLHKSLSLDELLLFLSKLDSLLVT
jgi:hypothetical protein